MAEETESKGQAQLIEHLVGSVLSSVVKAQGLAASQLVEMIEKVGFESVDGKRQTRMFSFDFVRSEVDQVKQEIVQRKVTASVPLLTLINLPSIAIHEATIEMELRLVAHEESVSEGAAGEKGPLKLFVVPSRKQLVRTSQQAFAIDSAGTIKLNVTMRQEAALGLDKLQSLLETGTQELVEPVPKPA